ncbi:MAG TPA: hypothetical protein DDW84_03895 [Phycisphaerales bacterium]|nr:MAG: hypothetical protein A2Y13_06970 [Planctomycetes bacterium GWC2_45_44]HBG77979.1 hypothetical protein [Phycisphaerales bacterium]
MRANKFFYAIVLFMALKSLNIEFICKIIHFTYTYPPIADSFVGWALSPRGCHCERSAAISIFNF